MEESFAEQYKQILCEKKIRKVTIANRLGMSKQALNMLLNSKSSSTETTMQKLATAIDCDLTFVLTPKS